jgi:hypothetical protein
VAILRFDKKEDFVNRFTLHPSRSYVSASKALGGNISGSIKLTPFNSTLPSSCRFSLRTDDLSADSPDGSVFAFDGTSHMTAFTSDLYSLQNDISASLFDPASAIYGTTDFSARATDLLTKIEAFPERYIFGPDQKTFVIDRFTDSLLSVRKPLGGGPGTGIRLSVSSTSSFKANAVRKSLYANMPLTFRKRDFAYSNAHSINFMNDAYRTEGGAESTANSRAVIYPDPTGSDGNAQYRPDGSFTFEFFINPRHTAKDYSAGTILHYSSTYALSLISGTSRGNDGAPDAFRLMLQLSSSADTLPKDILINGTHGNGTDDIYFSSDNSLKKNTWHHCAVRWGALDPINPTQGGTGSFVIDGETDASWIIPSASVTYPPGGSTYVGIVTGTAGREDPNALFLGNFYNAPNMSADTTTTARFFNQNARRREGLIEIQDADGATTADPIIDPFDDGHALAAELHEVRIFKEFRDINQINKFKGDGFGQDQFAIEKSGSLTFYLPPFFVFEAPNSRQFTNPFVLGDSSSKFRTSTPFNVTMSFNNEGFISNTPNFFRDFASNRYPRFFNLTGSVALDATKEEPVNSRLMLDPQMRQRNLLIVPNDNGKFNPDYTLLLTGTYASSPTTSSLMRRFVNDASVTDLSIISLNRMLDGRTTLKEIEAGGTLFEPSYPGVYPESPDSESADQTGQAFYNDQNLQYGGPHGDIADLEARLDNQFVITSDWELNAVFDTDGVTRVQSPVNPTATVQKFYVFEATGDESSNQAVYFSIPNIFYGKKIKPGTFIIRDPGLTGSKGMLPMTLRDDGFGSLYRANSPTPNKLHSVGNIFYDEGIVAIKSPHLYQFGSGSFEVGFRGTKDVFNREFLVQAPKNMLNSSSNPTYQKLAPTDEANETADDFVYITTVLLHDENLNVIGRAALSQPIVKRTTDAITFKLKKDF